MKILTIVGARPQFIKASVVSAEIGSRSDLKEIIVHTGQHYDENMSNIFFEQMNIPLPKYNLGISGGGHGAMTGNMLAKLEDVMNIEKPDIVLVYGDTNSTLAGALCAKKLKINIAHVEAGLRSFNMGMPEEINRILTDRISDLLFCPTETAIKNLGNEGFSNFDCKIILTGDVMYDAALLYMKHANKPNIDIKADFIVCTIHRAENTDNIDRLQNIVLALNEINTKTEVVCPIHPRTKMAINNLSVKPEFKIIEPVGYTEMLWLLSNCKIVMTDSGGLQKEAYFAGKYCVVMRDQTEWTELVDSNLNILAGAQHESIVSAATKLIDRKNNFPKNIYGDGTASKKIVENICSLSK